jgi:sugar lactone lactonase YvrE
MVVAFASKAQTLTDPWANIGSNPYYMAIDASNNIYVTSYSTSTISKITPNGTVTQFASLGGNEAYTISIDASGNLYAPFVNTNKIAKITSAGSANLSWVTFGDGSKPFSVIFDASGNLYSANASNSTVHKINSSGTILTTWTLATGSNFQLMTFDAAGNLYIACDGTSTVSKITPSGTATAAWATLTGKPAGIVSDADGNIFTANGNTSTISKISPNGTVTQAFASLVAGASPFNLIKDASGNLYTTNQGNNTVSKISYFPSVSITSSASGAICAGTSVTFTATAYNFSSTPTYQWYKNSVAINGEISASYTTSTLANADQIYVTATPGFTSGSVSTSNLIANFDAANYTTTSTRWNDLSTSANHMDFYTNTSYSTLKTATYSTDGGGSLILNNNSVYGKTINNTGISGNGGKTMSTWVKFDAADRDWTSIASIGQYGAYAALFELFGLKNGSGYSLWLVYDGGIVQGTSIIPLNTWANLTIRANGSNLSIIVNGVLDINGTQALSTTNSPIYLGAPKNRSNGGWDDNLRGRISTLSLYNAALSDQTILDNYNATKGRYTAAPGYTSNTLVSSINASPATPTITVTGDACANKTTLTTSTGLGTYAWYKDNVAISNTNTNTYLPTTAGDYKVQVTSGSCSSTSTATTIYTCGRTANGSMRAISSPTTLVSQEGGINFGTGVSEVGATVNATGIGTTLGTISATTAVVSGVISPTNALTSSIGVIYSTDSNFGTYSTSTTQSNVAAGTYSFTLSGLSSLTNYHAKAFITNKAGTSYGPAVTFSTPDIPLTVGTNYGGGKIFYIFQPGDPGYVAGQTHGLIAALSNQNIGGVGVDWKNNQGFFTIGASGTGIGTGLANTNAIINRHGSGTSYAAGMARAHNGGGYADWYLPSKDELNLMYLNIGNGAALPNKNIGNFGGSDYWSSSEANYYQAHGQWFGQDNGMYEHFKDFGKQVRAIRTF